VKSTLQSDKPLAEVWRLRLLF